MSIVDIDSDTAHHFAAALIDYAADARVETTSFSLPGFNLSVASDLPGYLELCRRALVDDPRLADGSQRPLAVSVLDRVTHPELPSARWTGEMYGQTLVSAGLEKGGYEGMHEIDFRLWQIFDARRSVGVEALFEPGQYAPWVASFPLRNFLHWAYQSIGWRIVHAGTLAVDGKGVMIVGAGGAGKSGTTLSGVLARLDSAGDDYVAIRLDDDAVRVAPVMKLMKQDGKGLARLGIDPQEYALGAPNWQNKYEFDFELFGAGRRASSIEIKAIVLPRIAHADRSTLSRARPQLAMMELAPSNLQQLPGGWRQGMSFIANLVRRVPAYHLDLSSDPAEIAATVRRLIEEQPA